MIQITSQGVRNIPDDEIVVCQFYRGQLVNLVGDYPFDFLVTDHPEFNGSHWYLKVRSLSDCPESRVFNICASQFTLIKRKPLMRVIYGRAA